MHIHVPIGDNVVPQAPPTNNYTVTDGNVTCFVMTAGIRLTQSSA